MFRILFLSLVFAAGAICFEPGWDDKLRTFSLRLRAPNEIAQLVSRIGTELVARAASALERNDAVPAVASGPLTTEQISESDRKNLDRLLEEKLRE
jgi:hypothetical protein